MAINFDSVFGIHEKALDVRSRRSEILANNIANADTPGFEAKDLDFRSILEGETTEQLPMATSSSSHVHSQAMPIEGMGGLLYRISKQPSLDGNTVDSQVETAEFTKNALQFQATTTFLNSKIRGILSAIKGE